MVLSLDALSDAYAQLIEGGDVPYSEPSTEDEVPEEEANTFEAFYD